MKSTRLFVLVVALVASSGCGDNSAATTDAAPDMGGLGTKCDDGIDNDGDGKTDYPADPGCVAPQADDETDDCPAGAGCPQCGNGIDDDGNGVTDYPNDPGCDSAADTTEVINDPVACGATLMIKNLPATGTDSGMLTTASTSQIVSPCGGGGGAAAIAYRLNLPQPTVIIASTAGSAFDTVLDLRSSDCDGTASEVACHDDVSSSNNTSRLTQTLPAGNYFLIVQGADTSALGNYVLNVERFAAEGVACSGNAQCGPGLVCRTPLGGAANVCSKPQCADTLDDDADGKNGFPTDPGCANLSDNDETDPTPLPACSNGADDDNDGMMDYPADTSCSSAGGNSEACNGEMDPITAITMGTTTGTLIGAHDDHNATCDDDSPGSGTDVLYTLDLPPMRSVQIDTEGSMADTVLSLLAATCTEPSLGCDDEGGTSSGSSRLIFNNLAGGSYIVAVDGYSSDTATFPTGTYNLRVTGTIAPGGSCEPALTLGGALMCPVMNPCEGTAGSLKCRPTLCGDGLDNDSPTDGKIDFPMDPGCTSLDDNDESDTCASGPGPGCPECADGIDNDGDTDTDGNDTTCVVGGMYIPGIPSEGCQASEAGGVLPLVLPVTAGDTTGDTDDSHPLGTTTCGDDDTAPDNTYSVELPTMRSVTFTLTPDFDGTLYLLDSSCGGDAIACDDNFSDPETLTFQNFAGGDYFLVVDGYGSEEGTYELAVSGTIQNGASCESDLAMSGAITCSTGFSCKGTAGSRTCRPAACNDGVDNDSPADGIADYPNDPGCVNTTDDDETDACPGGAGCPVCSDGVDNDSDGTIDYPDDPQCSSASSASEVCTSSDGLTALTLAVTPGTTVGAANDSAPACASSTNSAPDRLFSVTLPDLESLTIEGNTDFDSVLALYDATCGGTALQCNDSPGTISLGAVTAGTYYLVVDGYGDGSSFYQGTFALHLDGTIADGGSCESPLVLTGAVHCSAGHACAGTAGSRTCVIAQCSDGIENDATADGKIDFPFDPGCASPEDNDETDPTTAPVCSNAMDDDTDTLMDFPADWGCVSAAGTSEVFCAAELDATSLITATPVIGTTTGAMNNFPSLSCAFSGNSTGEDIAYGLSLPVPVASLVIDTSASAHTDTQLSFRDASCGVELGCDEDSGTGTRSLLTLTDVPVGNYSIIVDGYGGTDGAISMSVIGTVATGTDCSSPLFTGGANAVLRCPGTTTCTGTPLRCQ